MCINKYNFNGNVQAGIIGDNAKSSNNTFILKDNKDYITKEDADKIDTLIERFKQNDIEIDPEIKSKLEEYLISIKKSIKENDNERQNEEVSKFRKFLLTDLGEMSEKVKNGLAFSASTISLGNFFGKALGLWD